MVKGNGKGNGKRQWLLVFICHVSCYIAESDCTVPSSGKQTQRHYSDLPETSVCPSEPN